MENQDPHKVNAGHWIGALLLLIGGAVTAVVAGNNVQWARGSASWPTVTGTIERVGLVPATDRDDMYYALVEYRYTPADGVTRFGSKLRLESDPYARRTAEAMIAGLAPGQQRTVYYDPSDPDMAVLQPGAVWSEYTPAVIPPLLLAAGAWMSVALIRSRPRQESPLMAGQPLVR